jgi:hypothetical protein
MGELVDWERIGAAGQCGGDEFGFEDAQPMLHRFYRVVVP